MINGISKKIADRLLRKEVITQEEYEIYLFGMEQLLIILINLTTCVAVGIALGNLLQTLLLVGMFMGVRSYAGGYHASTRLRCYGLTTLIIVLSVVVLKYIRWDLWILIGILVVASIVILIFAPVDTKKKPIDDVEYVYFRKKTIVALSTEIVLAMLFVVLRFESGVASIVVALVLLAVALVCEKLKNRKGE